MSESKFTQEQMADFARSHPAADGWLICEADRYDPPYCTEFLPAFLRHAGAASILREDIRTIVGWSGKKEPTYRLREEPVVSRRGGLDEQNWFGDVEIVWKGMTVHVRRWNTVKRWEEMKAKTAWAVKSLETLEDLWKEMRKFHKTLSRPKRDIYICGASWTARPKATWNNLFLPDGMKEEIHGTVEAFLGAKRLYKDMGLPYRRGLLFAGPPGCGKTMTVKAVAATAKATVIIRSITAGLEDSDMSAAFSRAEEHAPSILILEDLDKIVECPKVSLSFMLNLMDGVTETAGMLVIATTNAPEKLDQALLHRPSRFDRVWHFGLPGYAERLALVRQRGKGRFSDAALERVARVTNGFTMAYVQEAVVNAMLAGVHGKRPVADEDLDASVERLRQQHKANMKADGALQPPAQVGFTPLGKGNDGNGNGGAG